MTGVIANGAADVAKQLRRGLATLNLGLAARQFDQLIDFLDLLEKWNRVYNLTAVRDRKAGVSVHLLDCLAIAPYVVGPRILDVGSGAGFPGIPLAIVKPESQVVLLDSNQKKTAFLRQAVGELGLANASVICERAEVWRPARKFDCVISRALGELADFVEMTKHLLAPGGVFAAMKGAFPGEEIRVLPEPFRLKQALPIAVPGLVAQRHLILIERA